MATRKKLTEVKSGGAYFKAPSSVATFTSGCAILDCVLGGGWARGRLINVVGDSGSGKSLLAIEAMANFVKQLEAEKPKAWYIETEAAFDPEYAKSLGIPMDKIEHKDDIYTVEDVFRHMDEQIDYCTKNKVPGLYIIDSLDAVSDEAEQEREIGEDTYGGNKPRKLSELFRRLNSKMSKADITVMVISQVRDKIGVAFGEKHTRAGGRALKFYASQELWLAYTGQLKKTIGGIENVYGVDIKAKTKKNRIAANFRHCEFPIVFNYGVDDVAANLAWLEETKGIKTLGWTTAKEALAEVSAMDQEAFRTFRTEVDRTTRQTWQEIEQRFAPSRSKY